MSSAAAAAAADLPPLPPLSLLLLLLLSCCIVLILVVGTHSFVRSFVRTRCRLSNCFNLIDHNCIPLMLECQAQGVKITNVGVFASGLL